jgi:hypothetical protein
MRPYIIFRREKAMVTEISQRCLAYITMGEASTLRTRFLKPYHQCLDLLVCTGAGPIKYTFASTQSHQT